ncbi:hypothetical protein ACFE04_008183 [Oxalis oulophora]
MKYEMSWRMTKKPLPEKVVEAHHSCLDHKIQPSTGPPLRPPDQLGSASSLGFTTVQALNEGRLEIARRFWSAYITRYLMAEAISRNHGVMFTPGVHPSSPEPPS